MTSNEKLVSRLMESVDNNKENFDNVLGAFVDYLEETDISVPIEQWDGTKKEFGKNIILALMEQLRELK